MRCTYQRRDYASLLRGGLVLAVFMGLPAGFGCSKPEEPPVAYVGPTLAAADLGLAQPMDAGANGFVLLEAGTSTGRFPAGLAVVRLDKPDPLFTREGHLFVAERGWEVATLKEEEAAYWNGLLSAVPRARSVLVVSRAGVISPDCSLDEVLAYVRRLKIELCLIYGPRMVADDSAGFAGVILDVGSGQQLAYVTSEAGVLDFEPPAPDRSKYDRSHQDVNYIAARRFEREVRNCILALIERDQPAATTQPSPWRTAGDSRVPADSVPVYIVPNRQTGTWD